MEQGLLGCTGQEVMENLQAFTEDPREIILLEQLISAQKNAVIKILTISQNECDAIEAVNHAAWFSATMRERCADPRLPAVACRERCHWCCNQLVGVSAPEVFRVTRYIETAMSPEQREKTRTKLHELDALSRGKSAKQRAQIPLRCAFNDKGSCQIYEARPLMCQRQTSYDVVACKKAIPEGFPFGSVLSERAALLTHSASMQGLQEGFQAVFTQAKWKPLEFISATVTALDNADAFAQWSVGRDIFADCELRLGH